MLSSFILNWPHFPYLVSLQRQALIDVQREERLGEKSMHGAVMAGGGGWSLFLCPSTGKCFLFLSLSFYMSILVFYFLFLAVLSL